MEENDVYFMNGTVTVRYYGFKLTVIGKWFCTCGINDFKKCLKTIKWACSDDTPKFAVIIDYINRVLKYSYPMIPTEAFDKKQNVLSKYRKEYLNYEF